MLSNMSRSRKVLLPFLESAGNQWEYLVLRHILGNLNLEDIMDTCTHLRELSLIQYKGEHPDALQRLRVNSVY